MASFRVVEALDVLEDRKPRFSTGFVVRVVDPFGFERVEEALRYGVVETVPWATHAALEAMFVEDLLVFGRAVLPTTIGVMDQP